MENIQIQDIWCVTEDFKWDYGTKYHEIVTTDFDVENIMH